MKLSRLSSALTIALFLSSIDASASLVGRPDASASFKAIGPAGLAIVGATHDLAVNENSDGIVTVSVALGGLTTGIDLRDKHMREKYLEVARYPTAVLTVPRGALQTPADGAQGTFDADATVTLHGRTRATRFRYTVKRQGNAFEIHGAMTVDMNDYGIATPSYLGVSVKPKVDVDVSFTAEDRR